MLGRSIVIVAASAALASSSGCLIVSGSSSYETGVRVTQATLAQVEVGTTTTSWLLATIGEPTSRRKVEGKENVEILVYNHRLHESSGGAVFLIFAGGKEHTTKSVAYFEVTEGIVTRHWVEG